MSSSGALVGLDGRRVLDLSDGIAGAYCTKLLLDAGADVLKLEPPGGDPLRRWSASGSVGRDGDEDGALFRYLAAGKQATTADLATAEGVSTALGLAATADIVVETFLPGVLERLGLGSEVVLARNPAATVVSISPFGRGGPDSAQDASEFLLQARSGSIHGHGLVGRVPVAVGGRLGEWTAGAYAALAAVTGVLGAQETGRGGHLDVSILECLATTLVSYPTVRATFPGGVAHRGIGVLFPSVEPCRDGFVGLYVLTAQQWASLFAMIDRPDLAADESLAVSSVRMGRSAELVDAIRAWTVERTVAEVVELAALHRLPVSEIGNGQTLPAMEHLVERQAFHPNPRGGFLQPRPPFRSNRWRAWAPGPAPGLGAGDVWTASTTAGAGSHAPAPPASPLAGLRVLDLTAFWAGPYGTLYLAGAGADVLKVESIQRPDPMRLNVSVPATDAQWWEQGALFNAINLGKRSVTLNLDDASGRALFLRLASTCDVVIENFTPRVMEQFGLGYEAFREVRPDIIMVRMPAFGLDGPRRDRAGFAPTMEQASGMAWITGYVDEPPIAPGGMCDPLAGVHAAFAVLVALEHRRRTGEGQLLELPMIELAANVTAEQVVEWSAYGELLSRQGNRGPLAAPQGVYACSGQERWFALAVGDDDQWRSLVRVLGSPGWATAPGLEDDAGRRRAHDAIDAGISEWAAKRDRDEVLRALQEAGVPAQPVVPSAEIDRDPQLRARGFWETVEHPIVGPKVYPAWPFRLPGRSGPWHRGPAPLLGEHSEAVLHAGLALGPAEWEALRAGDVTGTTPLGL